MATTATEQQQAQNKVSQFGHFGGRVVKYCRSKRRRGAGLAGWLSPCEGAGCGQRCRTPPPAAAAAAAAGVVVGRENQSDLEVIMDFLEEYYRQNRDHSWGNLDDVCWTTSVSVDDPSRDHHHQHLTCSPEPLSAKPVPLQPTQDASGLKSGASTLNPNRSPAAGLPDPWVYSKRSDPDPDPRNDDISASPASSNHPLAGRKTRLFHFLFEMLEDPSMAHCVSWVPAAAAAAADGAGVFRFSSGNKDQVAALWGQRKGNKRPMTYQKMSRALRNYARSGEIFKVKKKLTYQFGTETLRSLKQCRQGRH
ncbi:Transcription factor Spi-C [Merluccius polli]|uniref:Transcription factor Spi-C n=1 Tax=Merluccius polli TaxID=89951 RepID=A0AA47NVD2_MERPO|nr:Transcription factor Spi-C [Merluccius polli]